MSSRGSISLALISGLALATVAAAPAAHAQDGTANNGYGYTLYTDYSPDDRYKVCDQASDGFSAVGWIEVERDNGTWLKYATIKDTNGADNGCVYKTVFITRESARVKVVNCRQNGSAGGGIVNCDRRIYGGA